MSDRHRSILGRGLLAVTAAGLLLAVPAGSSAHEVPTDVTIQAFVHPEPVGAEGGRLRLLVRVPLEAMRDVELPLLGPGYLDLSRAGPALGDAARIWIADAIELYENGRPLGELQVVATRVSLPSDGSFGDWEQALAHVTGPPLDPDTMIVWQQALLDVLLEVPVESAGSDFSVDPALARLGMQTTTVLRFDPPGSPERVYQYTGDPGRVPLDPGWHQAALRFVELGLFHILEGVDHLLFLFCLVVPFRRFRTLVPLVTSFTAAHSITLIASAFGLAPSALWFPPLIETLIAASIVYMAIENIVGPRLERRWLITFGFGLVHGFGFSFVLRETLQFAGSHLVTSLLAFNVGVEIGQLAVLLLAIPVLEGLFRHAVSERMGTILLSALLAHQAWHWMTSRGSELVQYDFRWPALDALLLAAVMRWAMLALILGGTVWLLFLLFGRWVGDAGEAETVAVAEE